MMNDIFNKWKTRVPRYSEEYQGLFDSLSAKGGASVGKQVNLGKHFGNNYELYLFCFFLGLYRNEPIQLGDGAKKNDFGHPIQAWGSKTSVSGRKDYTSIQENIFSALIAKTDIDFIALEKGDITEEQVIRTLIMTMENFANGGLNIIKEKVEDLPNHFLIPTAFLDLILSSKAAK
jgi:hypothetical protein